ncbi:MAG: hypothetical protein ACR2JO_07380 [Mycobacteriales bacterium]
MTEGVAPAGWPAQVRPPGAPDWERTAVGWLFDMCPPEYRAYDVLRRYPVLLARFAAMHVGAAVDAARAGLATVRAELRGVVPPDAVEAAVAAYEREGARLVATGRAVALVDAALRGRRFSARL